MLGDCLERMKEIPDGSVDMVLADPPYGKTACKWDSVIDLPLMWGQLKRIIKPNGAIVMTAGQPFTSALISSNYEMFKYNWVWEKSCPSGFAQAKNKPLSGHEDICVFSSGVTLHASQTKRRMPYFPVGLVPFGKTMKGKRANSRDSCFSTRDNAKAEYTQEFTNYPRTTLKFNNETGLHQTQKPVTLGEYLIKTYTREGDTVLDFTMGSGSFGVSAKNLNRSFIGIEMDEPIFNTAKERIEKA